MNAPLALSLRANATQLIPTHARSVALVPMYVRLRQSAFRKFLKEKAMSGKPSGLPLTFFAARVLFSRSKKMATCNFPVNSVLRMKI